MKVLKELDAIENLIKGEILPNYKPEKGIGFNASGSYMPPPEAQLLNHLRYLRETIYDIMEKNNTSFGLIVEYLSKEKNYEY